MWTLIGDLVSCYTHYSVTFEGFAVAAYRSTHESWISALESLSDTVVRNSLLFKEIFHLWRVITSLSENRFFLLSFSFVFAIFLLSFEHSASLSSPCVSGRKMKGKFSLRLGNFEGLMSFFYSTLGDQKRRGRAGCDTASAGRVT